MRKLVIIEFPLEFEDDDEILCLPNEEIAKKIDETVIIEMSIGYEFNGKLVTVKDFKYQVMS